MAEAEAEQRRKHHHEHRKLVIEGTQKTLGERLACVKLLSLEKLISYILQGI